MEIIEGKGEKMDKVSIYMPHISVWKLIAKIDDYWLVPIIVKVISQKKYDIFLLEKEEIIKSGKDVLVSHEPYENLSGPVDTGIFACLYKDRFSPEFINSCPICQPIRISTTHFTTPMGGNEVNLLWLNGDWFISDENQIGLVPPFISVAQIFKTEIFKGEH